MHIFRQVESLYDSLTAYYDSKGQKRRNRISRQHSGTEEDDDGHLSTSSTNDRVSEELASSTAEIGSDGETKVIVNGWKDKYEISIK